jgi:hypothetical protein
VIFAVIAALSLATTDCGVPGARSIVDFEILQPPAEAIRLPQGLTLTFENGDEDGFSVVARDKPSDHNLLDWRKHGPDPSDLFAWSHFNRYYPDVRHLWIRNHRGELVIDLREVHSIADPEEDARLEARGAQLGGMHGAKFTDGTAHLCWRDTRSR